MIVNIAVWFGVRELMALLNIRGCQPNRNVDWISDFWICPSQVWLAIRTMVICLTLFMENITLWRRPWLSFIELWCVVSRVLFISRFGRRFGIIIAVIGFLPTSFGIAGSVNSAMYISLRTLSSTFGSAVYAGGFVLGQLVSVSKIAKTNKEIFVQN